jgi:hypothetical protein
MKRPTIRDESVIKSTAEELLVKINKWATEDTGLSVEDLEDTLNDICGGPTANGYDLAKFLDSEFDFEPDAQLVETLDGTWFIADGFLNKAIKEWVYQYKIFPGNKIGDMVSININKRDIVTGEITAIDTDLAKYTVCCESQGHVKKGIGTHGSIVNFEDIILNGAT